MRMEAGQRPLERIPLAWRGSGKGDWLRSAAEVPVPLSGGLSVQAGSALNGRSRWTFGDRVSEGEEARSTVASSGASWNRRRITEITMCREQGAPDRSPLG